MTVPTKTLNAHARPFAPASAAAAPTVPVTAVRLCQPCDDGVSAATHTCSQCRLIMCATCDRLLHKLAADAEHQRRLLVDVEVSPAPVPAPVTAAAAGPPAVAEPLAVQDGDTFGDYDDYVAVDDDDDAFYDALMRAGRMMDFDDFDVVRAVWADPHDPMHQELVCCYQQALMQPEYDYDAAFYDEDGWGRPAAPAARYPSYPSYVATSAPLPAPLPDDDVLERPQLCERDHASDPPLATIFCNNCGRYLCAVCHSLVHEGPTPPCLGLSCCTPLTPPAGADATLVHAETAVGVSPDREEGADAAMNSDADTGTNGARPTHVDTTTPVAVDVAPATCAPTAPPLCRACRDGLVATRSCRVCNEVLCAFCVCMPYSMTGDAGHAPCPLSG